MVQIQELWAGVAGQAVVKAEAAEEQPLWDS